MLFMSLYDGNVHQELSMSFSDTGNPFARL